MIHRFDFEVDKKRLLKEIQTDQLKPFVDPKTKIELDKRELKYLVNLITKEIYKMQESNVSFEGGYIDELYTKLK